MAPEMSTIFGIRELISTFSTKIHGHIINCYYTNWSQYRDGVGKFLPEDIDPTLCTHLTFSFAKVVAVNESIDNNEWTLEPYEWNDLDTEWSEGLYTRLNNLKKSNPILKVIPVKDLISFNKQVISSLRPFLHKVASTALTLILRH